MGQSGWAAVGLVVLVGVSNPVRGESDAVCARKLELALQRPNPAAAEALLKQGYADCGEGHGFLSAMAMAVAAQGDFERASELCLRELRSDRATSRALEVFLALFPRVSEPTRQRMLALGSTADAPLNIPAEIAGHVVFSRMVEQVYCQGTKLIGLTETADLKTEVIRYDVECPRGKVTPRFVRGAERPAVAKAGARLAVDRLIEEEELGPKFGVEDATALRERLEGPVRADRSQAWLLSWVADYPRQKDAWALLHRQNPEDLEAAMMLAGIQHGLGEREQALKTLRGIAPDRAELVDARGGAVSPSAIFTLQCRIRRRQNKVPEAHAACARALELGSKVEGPLAFGEVLFLEGKLEAALAQLEQSLEQDERSRRGWVVAALVNQKLGRGEAARERFAGSYGLSEALEVSLDDERTPAQWLALLDRFDDRALAAGLARCGHHYLDLKLPKQSAACFAASERIDPLAAKVARLEHQAETDPRTALRAARELLGKTRDVALLTMVARAHANSGTPHEGIPLLREALYKLPPWELPDELIRTVCGEVPLAECLKSAP